LCFVPLRSTSAQAYIPFKPVYTICFSLPSCKTYANSYKTCTNSYKTYANSCKACTNSYKTCRDSYKTYANSYKTCTNYYIFWGIFSKKQGEGIKKPAFRQVLTPYSQFQTPDSLLLAHNSLKNHHIYPAIPCIWVGSSNVKHGMFALAYSHFGNFFKFKGAELRC